MLGTYLEAVFFVFLLAACNSSATKDDKKYAAEKSQFAVIGYYSGNSPLGLRV